MKFVNYCFTRSKNLPCMVYIIGSLNGKISLQKAHFGKYLNDSCALTVNLTMPQQNNFPHFLLISVHQVQCSVPHKLVYVSTCQSNNQVIRLRTRLHFKPSNCSCWLMFLHVPFMKLTLKPGPQRQLTGMFQGFSLPALDLFKMIAQQYRAIK